MIVDVQTLMVTTIVFKVWGIQASRIYKMKSHWLSPTQVYNLP